MRHVRLGLNRELKQLSSGEKLAILVGRHDLHGGTRHHTVVLVELAVGLTSDNHFHRVREESYYFVSGVGIAKIADEFVAVTAGDLVYAAPGERHEFRNTGEQPLRYLVITAPCWSPEDSVS